jgi:hypothetical protein
MKSTPEQTQKRTELKRLVVRLGELAWQRYPEVAPRGVLAHPNVESRLDVVDYDEFFVVRHKAKAIPAKQTDGIVFLRFRRRVTKDGKHAMLWHVWEPGYAATKPEMVDEVFPVVSANLAALD